MIPLLSKFRYLKELSLHGNQLKSIPPLSTLKELTSLDLTNNPFNVNIFFIVD
jgi:Leucine-rich repeat (LRR) protein